MVFKKNPFIRRVPKMTGKTTGGHKSAGILDDYAIRKNIATKEGTIEKVPVNPSDIINKAYGDANYLAGGGDVTAAANLTDVYMLQGDGGAKGIKSMTTSVATFNTTGVQVGVNKVHVDGNGSDHANVASNTSDSHAQDTDTKLDEGGANEVAVAAIKSAVDASHAQAHSIASHNDTTGTGAELNTLTGGGDTTLHDHDGISENTTHRGSAGGTDHSDVSTNNSKVSYTKTNVKGHIEHGGTSGTTRPTGFTSVEWIGTVEPDNAVNGDTWIDTT